MSDSSFKHTRERMATRLLPDRLDLRHLAQSADTLTGEDALSLFPRLAAEAADAESRRVRWTARAEWRRAAEVPGAKAVQAPVLWLHLSASTELPLTCQRCLGPVPEPLEVDRWFRFVADEAAAEAQDDDCDEDLLALEPRPDMLVVLEDELLMALPLVPMHEVCPEPVLLADPNPLPEAQEVRPNPFAQLARLKPGRPE